MKKLFTLMLAFACAMFVGVSCTPDTPEDPNNGGNGGNEPVYTVTILAEASAESLAAEGGQFEVSYTLTSDELLTDVLTATSSASWLTASVAEGDEQKVCVEYTANPSVAEARQATLTLSYPGAKDVVLSYTQNHGVPAFNVTWEDATPKTVYAYIESLNDPNMRIRVSFFEENPVTSWTPPWSSLPKSSRKEALPCAPFLILHSFPATSSACPIPGERSFSSPSMEASPVVSCHTIRVGGR